MWLPVQDVPASPHTIQGNTRMGTCMTRRGPPIQESRCGDRSSKDPMTTRAQLQGKSIDELREVASAAGIETDGLQKSKLIAALVDAGEFAETTATEEVDLPRAMPRNDRSETPPGSEFDDDAGDNRGDNNYQGGNRQRNRRRRDNNEERIPEDQLEVREGILDILPEGYGFLRVTGLPAGRQRRVRVGQPGPQVRTSQG